jgi:hypothetical protein
VADPVEQERTADGAGERVVERVVPDPLLGGRAVHRGGEDVGDGGDEAAVGVRERRHLDVERADDAVRPVRARDRGDHGAVEAELVGEQPPLRVVREVVHDDRLSPAEGRVLGADRRAGTEAARDGGAADGDGEELRPLRVQLGDRRPGGADLARDDLGGRLEEREQRLPAQRLGRERGDRLLLAQASARAGAVGARADREREEVGEAREVVLGARRHGGPGGARDADETPDAAPAQDRRGDALAAHAGAGIGRPQPLAQRRAGLDDARREAARERAPHADLRRPGVGRVRADDDHLAGGAVDAADEPERDVKEPRDLVGGEGVHLVRPGVPRDGLRDAAQRLLDRRERRPARGTHASHSGRSRAASRPLPHR